MMDKLNNLSMNAKLGIMLVLAAVVGGILYYAVVMPKQDANTLLENQAKDVEKQNAELRPYKNRVADMDRDIASLKQQAQLYKLIIPDDKNADTFIISLQEQANNAGINLRKLNAQAIVTKKYYSEMPFTIALDGPYYQVLNFFDRLARQERYINVESLKVKNHNAVPGDVSTIDVDCTVKTFFSTPPAAAAALPKK